jgi:catechol 2,3-dioxygenase-like lactoylglutathione lyase family enzyme
VLPFDDCESSPRGAIGPGGVSGPRPAPNGREKPNPGAGGQAAGFGSDGSRSSGSRPAGPRCGWAHVAFAAVDRETVDRFHAAALEAGGTDNGAPGVCEICHPHYYGGYLLDPDGNIIEAVCHTPA